MDFFAVFYGQDRLQEKRIEMEVGRVGKMAVQRDFVGTQAAIAQNAVGILIGLDLDFRAGGLDKNRSGFGLDQFSRISLAPAGPAANTGSANESRSGTSQARIYPV